ncbi:MAG: IclR family transcriptional regulator [Desulfobacterales bacterium]|nr:IclR family transcriptional regulator [Desulfobacterales bacterium]
MIIQSVQRAMGILSLFSHSHPRLGITEMAAAMGLAKGTVHNLVHTLVKAGFLKQDPETRKYTLGHSIFALGTIMSGTLEINQKSENPAHQLATRTGFICRVAIWDKDAALVTLNVTPRHAQVLSRQIGPRVVAFCSAVGRVLLAHQDLESQDRYLEGLIPIPFTPHTIVDKDKLKHLLELTRRQGIAVNNQELALGYTSVAAAIFAGNGKLAAAISLTGPPDAVMGPEQENTIHQLRNTAAEISRYMGYFQAAPGTIQGQASGF